MKDKGTPKEVIGIMGTSENLIMTTKTKEQDQTFWELLAEWQNAQRNTASTTTTHQPDCGRRDSHDVPRECAVD
jgi:hypothetical protein